MKICITGANRGIGLGLTKLLISKKHQVIATTRNKSNSNELIKLQKNNQKNLLISELDITSETNINFFKESFQWDNLDILINNAGILENGTLSFEELTIETIKNAFEVNTVGPMKLTKSLFPYLKKSKNPKNIYITSKMGSLKENTVGKYYSYRMSKVALNMFCRTLAIDFPSIISTVLHPGWVKTDMGGKNATTTVNESANGLVNKIFSLTKEHSGEFYDYKGKKLEW